MEVRLAYRRANSFAGRATFDLTWILGAQRRHAAPNIFEFARFQFIYNRCSRDIEIFAGQRLRQKALLELFRSLQ